MEVSFAPDLTDSFRGIFDDLRGRERNQGLSSKFELEEV